MPNKKPKATSVKTKSKQPLLRPKIELPLLMLTIAIGLIVGISGYFIQLNSDAATIKSNVPNPPALSNSKFDSFVKQHIDYSVIVVPKDPNQKPGLKIKPMSSQAKGKVKLAIQKLGGNVFIDNLLSKHPNQKLSVIPNYTRPNGADLNIGAYGLTYTKTGNISVDGKIWDKEPNKIPSILIHEYIHALSSADQISVSPTLLSIFAKASADPNRRWDAYAFTNSTEYQACAFEWIILNEKYNKKETKRQRLKRMDPELYMYMVNTYIPWVYTRH